MLFIVVLLNLELIIFKITQAIWLEVREIGGVILVFKLIAEAESVESDDSGCFVVVLVAGYGILIELIVWSALPCSSL